MILVQGRFEIISLSGSFLLAEDGDTRSRTGGLSVALAGSDGRVLGGCVAGQLTAATPVQVLLVVFFCFSFNLSKYFETLTWNICHLFFVIRLLLLVS
jgi:hypothetical protein